MTCVKLWRVLNPRAHGDSWLVFGWSVFCFVYVAGIIKIAHLSGKSVGVPLADPVSPTPCVMTTEMAKARKRKRKKIETRKNNIKRWVLIYPVAFALSGTETAKKYIPRGPFDFCQTIGVFFLYIIMIIIRLLRLAKVIVIWLRWWIKMAHKLVCVYDAVTGGVVDWFIASLTSQLNP